MVLPCMRSFQEISQTNLFQTDKPIKEIFNSSIHSSNSEAKEENIASKRNFKKSILRLKKDFHYPIAS